MGFKRFVGEIVGLRCTRIFELVSSGSDALELESRSTVKVLHSAEFRGTASSGNHDHPAHSLIFCRSHSLSS